MRVLLDQGTPVGIRRSLREHDVRTANQQGWSQLSNGEILRAAEVAGFDVLLTTDASIPFQQNLEGRRIAVVAINKNRWMLIQQALPRIVSAIAEAKPGTWTIVEIP